MRLRFLDSFEFGIPDVDKAHRRIFFIFNEIGDLLEDENFDSALRQVIHLIAVERAHVRYETKILEELRPAQASKHKEYHIALHQSLNDLMIALGDQDEKSAEKYYENLCENILDDILKADLPFKSLFQDEILNR